MIEILLPLVIRITGLLPAPITSSGSTVPRRQSVADHLAKKFTAPELIGKQGQQTTAHAA